MRSTRTIRPYNLPPGIRRPFPARLGPLPAAVLLLTGLLLPLLSPRAAAGQEMLERIRPAMRPMQRLPFSEPARPRVGLALSGGGSRGMAHIGTLMALEEAGLKPDYIAGTSSGAVIGGLYAAGWTPEEMAGLVGEVDWPAFFTNAPERRDLFLAQKEERASYALQVRFDGFRPVLPTSYLTGQRVRALLSELTFPGDYRAGGDFDDLTVPFRAVCTDLLTGERVTLGEGSLSEALMASSAIPVLLSAIPIDGRMLVDGGLVDAIPVGVVRDMGAEVLVASDVSAALRPVHELSNPLEVVDQVMSITMRGPNRRSLEMADLVVSPSLPDHLSSDFGGLDSLVTVGRRTAREGLARWESAPESRHLVRLAGVHPEHGPGFLIRGVEVEGASPAQRERARAFLARELAGRSTDRVGLEAAAAGLMMNDGSLSDVRVEVLAAGRDPTPEAGNRPIQLQVALESQPFLRQIRFEGARYYDPPELRRAISSEPGGPVDRLEAARDVRSLQTYYRDRGFPLALVREVTFDAPTGVLTFRVDEGRIEEIRVLGLEHTRPFVVLRELPFREGEVFGETSVQEIIDNIAGTGLFERVRLRPERGPSGGLVLVVEVTERPRHLARLGVHYQEDLQTEGFLEYQDDNLLGIGGKLRVRALTGARRQSGEVETRLDRLFETFLTYRLKAGWERRRIHYYRGEERTGSYEDENWTLSASVGQQVRRLGQVSLGFKVEDVVARAVEGAAIAPVTHRIRGFELRSTVDTLDRTPYPTSGVRHEFAYETSADVLDANISYVKMYLDLETFVSRGRHTFHPRFYFATADNALPAVRWFRAGGMDSFYGYSLDQLRGRQILLISGEYRFRIPWGPVAPLVLSARWDLGGAWGDPLDMALGDLVNGGGLKLGIDSPVGPLEAAWGIREGGYERFYLGLGYRF
ncbi:MAG: patatin-like phospholipase family protein [bacterium]